MGGFELADKFENMVGDIAWHCYERAAAEALQGFLIRGEVRFSDDLGVRVHIAVPATEVTA